MGIFFFWFCTLLAIATIVIYKFLKTTPPGQFLHKFDNTWWAVLGHAVTMFNITAGIICWYFFLYLPNTTNHGQIVFVPDLVGKKVRQVESILDPYKLNYVVTDTIWNENAKPGSVLKQNPSAKSEVKEGRKIYLTINNTKAPQVIITEDNFNQINLGYKYNVIQELKNLKFKVTTSYELSPYRDYVLRSEYRNRPIRVGDKIPQGSIIDVILGDGKKVIEEEVPSEEFILDQIEENELQYLEEELQ